MTDATGTPSNTARLLDLDVGASLSLCERIPVDLATKEEIERRSRLLVGRWGEPVSAATRIAPGRKFKREMVEALTASRDIVVVGLVTRMA